ncbi:MAG: polyphosphate kinase 2, partial [Gammaproteobacteria bacterium]|nr:polyphosphate kinase 2 [Gammaproteobacteria bacterium]
MSNDQDTSATGQVEDKLTLVQDVKTVASATKADELQKVKDKAYKKHLREEELKPFQAELIKMQKYLEDTNTRMIILFEGRDAAGKGGTIRRVTRYMNVKHYRIVALGKPTESERSEWFFQKYIRHFPQGGEVVMFDRSWYNRAMVEPV